MPRRAALALAVALIGASTASAIPPEARTQFVLVSLDTTPSGRRPVEDTDFYRLLRAMNADPERATSSYTVFVSTGGLTLDPRTEATPETRAHVGVLPRNRPVMRYAEDLAHLEARAAAVRRMAALGIEIGSHGVRHEHGAAWSRARWRFELTEHRRIATLLGLPRPVGFRAPFLEHNPAMYEALGALGFRYDVSRTGGDAWPTRHPETGIWLFGIPSVRVPGVDVPVLLFDDNLRRVLARRVRDRPAAEREAAMDAAFLAAIEEGFERSYRGSRAPFLISGHGGFITPTQRFLRRACRRPHVRCATFSEAVAYMEAHPELEGVRE